MASPKVYRLLEEIIENIQKQNNKIGRVNRKLKSLNSKLGKVVELQQDKDGKSN